MAKLPAKSEWLRAPGQSAIGVDEEKRIIRGYVVAQEGPFKSEGRGEFDHKSLRTIVALMKAAPGGLKSRFTHPGLSEDGLGKFLGRAKDPRREKILKPLGDGTFKEIEVVRADLHLNETSFDTPNGDLGGYVMRLAKSDPEAFSSSLVLKTDEEYRLKSDGTVDTDDAGNPLPPLWRPTELHASDVVDTGDAVDSFLSASDLAGLPDEAVRAATKLLSSAFPDVGRDVIRSRCLAYLDRYLDMKFGEPQESQSGAAANKMLEAELDLRRRLAL